MFDYTSKDTAGLYAPRSVVKAMLDPTYSNSHSLTELRPAWWQCKPKKWRFLLDHMMPGTTLVVDHVETYRKKTISRWWVEGVEYPLDAAVNAIGIAAEKKDPLPFFKLSSLQKRILWYWLEYEREVGEPPYITEATRALKRSIQYLGEQVNLMSEWDIMYKVGGNQAKELWHVNWDRLTLISLEDE